MLRTATLAIGAALLIILIWRLGPLAFVRRVRTPAVASVGLPTLIRLRRDRRSVDKS